MGIIKLHPKISAFTGTILSGCIFWGASMILPSTPHNGISIIILALATVFLIWELVFFKHLQQKRRVKMIFGIGTALILIGIVLVATQLNYRQTPTVSNAPTVNTTLPNSTVLGALPPFVNGKQEFTLKAGMLVFRGTISDLMSGQPRSLNMRTDEGLYNLVSVYIKDRIMYVDTTLYGGDKLPSVQLTQSVLVSEPQGWDVNADSNAIEIVDDRQNPVVQIIFQTYYQIVINGFLYFPGGFMFVDEDGRTIMNPKTPVDYSLKRIFKYPSLLYQGVREVNQ
jgi:hypothetical protein